MKMCRSRKSTKKKVLNRGTEGGNLRNGLVGVVDAMSSAIPTVTLGMNFGHRPPSGQPTLTPALEGGPIRRLRWRVGCGECELWAPGTGFVLQEPALPWAAT